MTDYLSTTEELLEAAQARIAELELELEAWRCGARSFSAVMVAEKLASADEG